MQNRIILCVGHRGSGKSTVSSGILKANNGSFLFDPHFDLAYSWIPNRADCAKKFNDYARWVGEAGPKRIACRYVPSGLDDPFDEVNNFCRVMWNVWGSVGEEWPVWMGIEEIAECCKSPSAAGMPPELRRIVNQGRHRGLNQIYCGLRFSEMPRPISAGADVQILFACREPLDLDSMRMRIGSEATEQIQGLGRHEALVFFPDRTWQVIGSRDLGIAELVLQDTANVSENVGQERT